MPWPRFLLRAGLPLFLVLGAGAYLAERFRIGYDDQDRQCLPPYRWFLIDRHDRAVSRGTIVAFAARGLGPYFHDGQTIVKRAAGVPGDRVAVDLDQVQIDGATVGEGLALARTLKRPPGDFLRNAIVPPEHL
jgi:conjugal transfer pilin signal peptidase TrbI